MIRRYGWIVLVFASCVFAGWHFPIFCSHIPVMGYDSLYIGTYESCTDEVDFMGEHVFTPDGIEIDMFFPPMIPGIAYGCLRAFDYMGFEQNLLTDFRSDIADTLIWLIVLVNSETDTVTLSWYPADIPEEGYFEIIVWELDSSRKEDINWDESLDMKLPDAICKFYGNLQGSFIRFTSESKITNNRNSKNMRTAISPSPFNSCCKIDIPGAKQIHIYNTDGRRVKEHFGSSFIWYPDETIASGVYLVRAKTEDGWTVSKKVVYLR